MGTDVVTLQVGVVAPAVVNAPLWLAEDAQEFTRRGLRISTRVVGSTHGTTAALLEGGIDVAFGSPDAALVQPDRMTILAGIVDRPPLSLVARRGLASFEALRGKSFGTTSLREGTVQLIAAMLAEHGLHHPDDYDLVIAGSHPQRWRALQEGTLDAALQLMPFDTMALDAGFPVVGRAEDVVPYFAFSSVCVRTDFPAELSARFREALLVGEHIVRTDRPRAVRVVADRLGISTAYARRCVERLVDGGVMPTGLVHSAEAISRTRQAIRDNAPIAARAAADPELPQ